MSQNDTPGDAPATKRSVREQTYMTISESAEYLRISVVTFRLLRRRGELPRSYGLKDRPISGRRDLGRWVLSLPHKVGVRKPADDKIVLDVFPEGCSK